MRFMSPERTLFIALIPIQCAQLSSSFNQSLIVACALGSDALKVRLQKRLQARSSLAVVRSQGKSGPTTKPLSKRLP